MSKIIEITNKCFEKGDVMVKFDDSLVIPTGGIVMNNSKIKDIVDKLFNTKPNEQVVKLLTPEQVIHDDIMSIFIPNIKNLVNTINKDIN